LQLKVRRDLCGVGALFSACFRSARESRVKVMNAIALSDTLIFVPLLRLKYNVHTLEQSVLWLRAWLDENRTGKQIAHFSRIVRGFRA